MVTERKRLQCRAGIVIFSTLYMISSTRIIRRRFMIYAGCGVSLRGESDVSQVMQMCKRLVRSEAAHDGNECSPALGELKLIEPFRRTLPDELVDALPCVLSHDTGIAGIEFDS